VELLLHVNGTNILFHLYGVLKSLSVSLYAVQVHPFDFLI
jgi:hypothetical protein